MTALDTVLTFLQGKGLTPAQAAGVAANLDVESHLNAASTNPAEGAVGVAQWEGGRRAALDSYAARTGGSEQDLTTQLNFLWSEFQGSESSAYRKLIATNDAGTAAAVVDQYYERSSGSTRAQRVAEAQAIAAGQPASAGAAGGTVQNAGFLGIGDGWATDVARIALKVGGGVIAGVLVVVGLNETVKGSK